MLYDISAAIDGNLCVWPGDEPFRREITSEIVAGGPITAGGTIQRSWVVCSISWLSSFFQQHCQAALDSATQCVLPVTLPS